MGRPVHHGRVQLDDALLVRQAAIADGHIVGIVFDQRHSGNDSLERIGSFDNLPVSQARRFQTVHRRNDFDHTRVPELAWRLAVGTRLGGWAIEWLPAAANDNAARPPPNSDKKRRRDGSLGCSTMRISPPVGCGKSTRWPTDGMRYRRASSQGKWAAPSPAGKRNLACEPRLLAPT